VRNRGTFDAELICSMGFGLSSKGKGGSSSTQGDSTTNGVSRSGSSSLVSGHGLVIREGKKVTIQKAGIFDNPTQLSVKVDLAIIATKANSLIRIAQSFLPYSRIGSLKERGKDLFLRD